jgi:hypothetical protein
MVELRKLTGSLITNFPDPSAKPVLQINGLFEMKAVLRWFSSYRIVQNRAEVCRNVQKMAEKRGYSRRDFSEPCQVRLCLSSCIGRNWRRASDDSFLGTSRATEAWRGLSIDSERVTRQAPERSVERHSGFRPARLKRGEVDLLILKWLIAAASQGKSVGRPARLRLGMVYLLIRQWLIAKFLRNKRRLKLGEAYLLIRQWLISISEKEASDHIQTRRTIATWRGLSIDSPRVNCQISKKKSVGRHSDSSHATGTGIVYLLILKLLFAKFLRKKRGARKGGYLKRSPALRLFFVQNCTKVAQNSVKTRKKWEERGR